MPEETNNQPEAEAQDAKQTAQDAPETTDTPEVPEWAQEDPARAYKEAQKAREEAAKYRTEKRELQEAWEREKKERERAEMSERDRLEAEKNELAQELEAQKERVKEQGWRADLAGKVADPAVAIRILDRESHLTDEGNVNVDAFLEAYPFMRPAQQGGSSPATSANPTKVGSRAKSLQDLRGASEEEINAYFEQHGRP